MERLITANKGEFNIPTKTIPEVHYELTDSSQTKLDITIYGQQNNNKMNNFLKALSVIRNKGEAENIPYEISNKENKEMIKKENFITSIKAIQIGNNTINNILVGNDFSRNNKKISQNQNFQNSQNLNSFSPPMTITANTTTEYDKNISENSYNNANLTLEDHVINYINNPVEKNIQIKNNEIRVSSKIIHHSGRVANIPYKMEVILRPLLKDPIRIIEEEEGEKDDEINLAENIKKLEKLKIGKDFRVDGALISNKDNNKTNSKDSRGDSNINTHNLNSYRTNVNNTNATTKGNTVVNSKNKSTYYTNDSANNGPFAAGDNIFLESPDNRRSYVSNAGDASNVKGSASDNVFNLNVRAVDGALNNIPGVVAPFSLKINPKIPKAKNGASASAAAFAPANATGFNVNSNTNTANALNPFPNAGLDVNSTPSLSSNLDDLDEIKEINLNEYHFDGTGGPSISPYNHPNNHLYNKKLNISDLDIFNLHLDFDISNGNINNKNSKILIVDSMLNSSNSPINNDNKDNLNSDLNMSKNKSKVESKAENKDSFLRKKKNLNRKNTEEKNLTENNLSENFNENLLGVRGNNIMSNTNSTTKKIRRKYFKSEIFEGKTNNEKLEEDELNEGLSAIEAFGDLGNLDEDYEINQFVMKNQKENNNQIYFKQNINNTSSSRSISNLSQRKVNKNLLKKFNSTNPNTLNANNSNNANYFSKTNLFNNNKQNQILNEKQNEILNGKNNLKENILQIDTERTNQSEKALEIEEEYEIEEIDLRTEYENTGTLTEKDKERERDEINLNVINTEKDVLFTNRNNNQYTYLQATEKKDTNHKKRAFRSFILNTDNSASGTSNYILNEKNNKVNTATLNNIANTEMNRKENNLPNSTANNNAINQHISPYTNYNLISNYNQHLPINITTSLNNTNPVNTLNTLNTINSISMKSNFSNTASSSIPNSNSQYNTQSNNTHSNNLHYPFKTPDNKIRKHNTLNDLSILFKPKNVKNSQKSDIKSEYKISRKIQKNDDKNSQSQSFISQDSFIDTVFDLDFINNLLAKENYYKADPCYLQKHPRLELSYRSILIEWLMELCEEYAFKRDTFHYAVNYVDRFLSKLKDVSKMSLQLIGVTSLSIAAKFEEVQIPKIQDYLNATDNSYSQEEFIATERLILKTLRWEIIPTTINTWLNWYVCQWDLYLDSFPENLEKISLNEKEPIYFKKADETSYIHYRMITQLIDLYTVDYFSLKFSSRCVVAANMLLVLSRIYEVSYFVKENLRMYDFDEKFFRDYLENTEENFLVEIFSDFMHQGFNISTNDEEFVRSLVYCAKFLSFEFNFNLPLVLQGSEDNGLENVSKIK
jgi:hypothetical protein